MKIINPKVTFDEGGNITTMSLSFTEVNEKTGDKTIYNIPKIVLNDFSVSRGGDEDAYWQGLDDPRAVGLITGNPKLQLLLERDSWIDCQVIKKPRELSMEEIEKKLGYPVKIIK